MFNITPFIQPFIYAYQAYKSTSYELPLVQYINGQAIPVPKNDCKRGEAVRLLPGAHLKETMKPLLDKIGIRKDLIFVEMISLGLCGGAVGTNVFKQGDAAILIGPGLESTDKEASHFLVKHEISHIVNNDMFTMKLVPAICSAAAVAFTASSLLIVGAGFISGAIFSQYREAKADDFAIAESSIEELKGGRRFFISVLEVQSEKQKKTLFELLFISSTGENRADLRHPSLKSRVQKIENALHQKGIELNETEERKKIENLKSWIVQTNTEVNKEVDKVGFFQIFLAQFR